METSFGDWERVSVKDKDVLKYNKTNPADFEYKDEEKLEPANNIIKDVIDALDRDVTQDDSMTSIDFNTHLNVMEIPALTTLQMLSSLGLGGKECSILARRIQRNKVSIDRKGREDKVKIIQGEREHETANKEQSLFGKIKGYMGGGGNKNE